MKAFVVEKYGKDALHAAAVPEPVVGPRDVLVRVSAASINPLDVLTRNGEFKRLIKYKPPFVLGHDLAGVITEVGGDVRDFQVGDEVYARPRDLRIGTFAELIAIDQDDVAPKPTSLTLPEAAAVPLVALAAWQILVDRAHLQQGQKVLVHAGAGGLGSTVIQLASTSAPSWPAPPTPPPQTWSGTSGPTSSSTTPSRTSPRCCPAMTWWSTPSGARTWRSRSPC
jgi:NADPH:quinone reductase-like Zn-dependent oxidoreductase